MLKPQYETKERKLDVAVTSIQKQDGGYAVRYKAPCGCPGTSKSMFIEAKSLDIHEAQRIVNERLRK